MHGNFQQNLENICIYRILFPSNLWAVSALFPSTALPTPLFSVANAMSAFATKSIAPSTETRWKGFCAKRSTRWATPLATPLFRRSPCSRSFYSSVVTTKFSSPPPEPRRKKPTGQVGPPMAVTWPRRLGRSHWRFIGALVKLGVRCSPVGSPGGQRGHDSGDGQLFR